MPLILLHTCCFGCCHITSYKLAYVLKWEPSVRGRNDPLPRHSSARYAIYSLSCLHFYGLRTTSLGPAGTGGTGGRVSLSGWPAGRTGPAGQLQTAPPPSRYVLTGKAGGGGGGGGGFCLLP